MSDQERFDQLSRLIDAQRSVVHRLYDEWTCACKGLNQFEREQSALFRKIAEGPAVSFSSGVREGKS